MGADNAQLCLVDIGRPSSFDKPWELCCNLSLCPWELLGNVTTCTKRMPVFERAIYLLVHPDSMVQAAARTIVLCLLHLKHPDVRIATESASARLLAPILSRIAGEASLALHDAIALQDDIECLEGLLRFVGDLFALDIK